MIVVQTHVLTALESHSLPGRHVTANSKIDFNFNISWPYFFFEIFFFLWKKYFFLFKFFFFLWKKYFFLWKKYFFLNGKKIYGKFFFLWKNCFFLGIIVTRPQSFCHEAIINLNNLFERQLTTATSCSYGTCPVTWPVLWHPKCRRGFWFGQESSPRKCGHVT